MNAIALACELHANWLDDKPGGKTARFSGLDISGVDFANKTLRGAYFRRTSLRGANFAGVDCAHAEFIGADCTGAMFEFANMAGAVCLNTRFTGADCSGSDFTRAWVNGANFRGADCSGANFKGADCRDADFTGADCSGAVFAGARLKDATLDGATLPEFWVCPKTGAFTAYKRAGLYTMLRVLIPAHAARTSSLVGRKCRASEVVVAGVVYGPPRDAWWRSDPDRDYVVGETIVADDFSDDIRVEDAGGVAFYMSAEEAEEAED